MPYYILVTLEQEVEVYTTPEMLTTEEIEEVIGIEGVPANYEMLEESNVRIQVTELLAGQRL